MIVNPSYQLLVANGDHDLNVGLSALKSLALGQICLVNEDDPEANSISNLKRFSLYQKAINDKGKEVMIKHSGALPIVIEKIQNKTYYKHSAGEKFVAKLDLGSWEPACCQDFTIMFNLYSEAIQKTQFPNGNFETISVTKECCEAACGGSDNPFSVNELLAYLWRETALANGYVKAELISNATTKIVAKGNKFNDGTYSGEATDTEKFKDFADNMSGAYSLYFYFDDEDENYYGQTNLKYDNIRYAQAYIDLKDGFKCAGVLMKTNKDSGYSAGDFVIGDDTQDVTDTPNKSVGAYKYPVGLGYDVKQMEFGDSLHTLNSPYTLSDITYSENGIRYRATEDFYDLLTIEYQQPSDGTTRVEHHPHGTTIAIDNSSGLDPDNKTNWNAFASAIGVTL